MIIPVKFPTNNTVLSIQVFDNDLLSHDEFICGTDFELDRMLRDLYYIDVPMKFDLPYFDDMVATNPLLKENITFPDIKEKNNFWLKLYRMEGVTFFFLKLDRKKASR